ncbi:MAG: ZIP family metal transporter, partial [Gemmatimonadota bacterium]
MPPVLLVLVYGTITALATGLGALPFAFVRRLSPRIVAVANALAGGLMLGASFGLIAEGANYGSLQTLAGGTLGVAFILITQRVLDRREVRVGEARGADARQMMLMVIVMTVHSFSEGVAVGVSFGGGATLAAVITIAIA